MDTTQVIKRPILTEKATNQTKNNLYTFEIHVDASKHQVTAAIERLYKVKVSGVRIMNREGKMRRVGRKMQTARLPNTKIAYIQLKEGKIDIFPQA